MAASSSSPRRRSRAGGSRSRSCSGTSSALVIATLLVFVAPGHRRRRRVAARRRDPGRARRPATRSGSGLLALVAGALAFALAQFVGRGAAVGIAGAVMFAGFILNGYQQRHPRARAVRQPDLVRLDGQPPPAGRPVRLGVGRPRGGRGRRPARHRRRGVRPPRHRRRPAPSRRRACRAPSSACAVRPTGPSASCSRSPWHGASASGIFGLMIAGLGSVVHRAARRCPGVHASCCVRSSRTSTSRRSAASCSCCSSSSGWCWPGSRRRRSSAAGPSDETSGRLEFLLATPLSRRRWVDGRRDRHRSAAIVVIVVMSVIGIAIGAATAGGDVVTPIVGTLVLGLYRDGDGRRRRRDRRRARARFAGPAVAVIVDRHLVPRHPRPGARPAGCRPRAGADGALRAADARQLGRRRRRSRRWSWPSAVWPSARGASGGATSSRRGVARDERREGPAG